MSGIYPLKAVFCKTVDEKLINSKDISDTLRKGWWQIYLQNYYTCKWSEVFKHMLECSAEIIWILSSKNKIIIKQIQDVYFVNLSELKLYGNQIQNIQALNFITCYKLRQLDLGFNKISHVKCLSKLLMPSLQYLDLSQNRFKQVCYLNRSKINQHKFEYLCIQRSLDQIPTKQDISDTIKIPSQIKILGASSKRRIQQIKMLIMLKSKSLQIQIRYYAQK